jgi:hypothetical protein
MIIDENLLQAGLINGLGLTVTCKIMGLHPRDASQYYIASPGVLMKHQKAILNVYKLLLTESNSLLKDKKIGQWKHQNELIKQFVGDIVLWESRGNADIITPKLVTAVLLELDFNREESATALGLDKTGLINYILEKPAINLFIKENFSK